MSNEGRPSIPILAAAGEQEAKNEAAGEVATRETEILIIEGGVGRFGRGQRDMTKCNVMSRRRQCEAVFSGSCTTKMFASDKKSLSLKIENPTVSKQRSRLIYYRVGRSRVEKCRYVNADISPSEAHARLRAPSSGWSSSKGFLEPKYGGPKQKTRKLVKAKKKKKACERNRFCQVSSRAKEKTGRLSRDAEGRRFIYMVP